MQNVSRFVRTDYESLQPNHRAHVPHRFGGDRARAIGAVAEHRVDKGCGIEVVGCKNGCGIEREIKRRR